MNIKYLMFLPTNVVTAPDIWSVDVVPLGRSQYTVQFTDAWGKTWYPQLMSNKRCEWTRNTLYAKVWTLKTARKYAEHFGSLARECYETSEGGR